MLRYQVRACSSPTEIGYVVSALFKILIAGGALLAVPALLIGDRNGREYGELLYCDRDVGQIRNRAVAVLEVEGVEELFGLLRGDFLERLLHGQRRAGVLGHGIGLDFGLYAIDGKDFNRL